MAYIDAANYNKIKSQRGFPIGSIVPFSGSIDLVPKGWLTCSGGSYNVNTYPLLYKCIGNTYGGTAGSTFALPALNNRSIVDIFQGHYQHLRTTSATYPSSGTHPMQGLTAASWCPNLSSTQSTDLYWNQIGEGTSTLGSGGDTGSNNVNSHFSKADLVGERGVLSSDLVASVTGISLTSGNYSQSYNILERKLGDAHWRSHGHGISSTTNTGYRIAGTTASGCQSPYDSWCYTGPNCTDNANYVSPSRVVLTTTTQNAVCGGGNTTATRESPGDGCTQGDMLAALGGSKRMQSSLSSDITTFAALQGHDHGSSQMTFTSRLVAQQSFTLSTIGAGTVIINNSAGLDAATINMISDTPSLAMLFIIRAF